MKDDDVVVESIVLSSATAAMACDLPEENLSATLGILSIEEVTQAPLLIEVCFDLLFWPDDEEKHTPALNFSFTRTYRIGFSVAPADRADRYERAARVAWPYYSQQLALVLTWMNRPAPLQVPTLPDRLAQSARRIAVTIETEDNTLWMTAYRNLEQQLIEMREAHEGRESPDEEQLLESLAAAWLDLSADDQALIRSEGPKTWITEEGT